MTSHIDSLCLKLEQAGHQTTRVAIVRSLAVEDDRTFLPSGPLPLLSRVRSLQPDIIHVHVGGQFSTRVGIMIQLITVVTNAPVVVTIHSGEFPASAAAGSRINRLAVSTCCRASSGVIAVNDSIAEAVTALGVPRTKVHRIAPHSRISPDRVARDLPTDLKSFFQAHSPVFISVGQLEAEYQLHHQIEALRMLRDKYPAAGLITIGTGSLHEPLKEKAKQMELSEDVLVYGGLSNPATLLAIARSDLLLRTTSFDGDAISIREALQLETAVVASDVAPRPAGVLVYKAGDLVSLVTTMELAIRDGVVANPGVKRVRNDVDELDTLVRVYESLLEGR